MVSIQNRCSPNYTLHALYCYRLWRMVSRGTRTDLVSPPLCRCCQLIQGKTACPPLFWCEMSVLLFPGRGGVAWAISKACCWQSVSSANNGLYRMLFWATGHRDTFIKACTTTTASQLSYRSWAFDCGCAQQFQSSLSVITAQILLF